MATVRQERFPEFLRYHLQCELPRVRSPRLFKLVRERVRNGQETFALLEALERRAEVFAAIFDPQHAYWVDRKESAPFVRELNVLRVRQMTPLVFAAWERLEAADFARVLKMLVVVLFRYSAVSGLNTNALELVFHQAAKGVLDGRLRSPSEIFGALRTVYVEDAAFQQAFSTMTPDGAGQGKKLIRYILARLEQDASGRSVDPDVDPGTVEHILPANPSAAWSTGFPRETWERFIDRLGNMTWLESALNREVGNSELDVKCAAYRRSGYALSNTLPDLIGEDWTPEKLNARQAHLASRAIHIWRSDFVQNFAPVSDRTTEAG